MKKLLATLAICFLLAQGCVSVEAYQRMYLDDPDMILGPRKSERLDAESESYREGAAGGNQGAVAGGCGCF